MGSSGSGRRWHYNPKRTTEGLRSIDVRKLKRDGALTPGASHRIMWSRRDEVVASVDVTAEPDHIILAYRHRVGGADWRDAHCSVFLTKTACHLGGERYWFLCPARECGKRVAVLYAGGIFACRGCHQLAYASQREDSADRAARRVRHIRKRLGWPGGIREGSDWGKPKGMHWRTYERLCREHERLEEIVDMAFIDRCSTILRKYVR